MSGRQLVVERPLVAIVEAKNDNVMNGMGQCIAAMFAAHLVNEREGGGASRLRRRHHGYCVEIPSAVGTVVTVDVGENYIDNVGKVLGVFRRMVQGA